MGKSIFDKIWDSHVVKTIDKGPSILYIDRHYIHEVTSPQAFNGLEIRNLPVFRPEKTFATCDHNVPTINQDKPIKDASSRLPIEKLEENTTKHKIQYFPLGHRNNGVVHIIGPELGLTQCGMTIVCGDSHTSTHGALGNIAFGIGTSEVEMVLASQTILQEKPKQMLIKIEGELNVGVCAKDLILYTISKLGTSAGTGYFLEFAGSAIDSLSIEERMTVCNMSIEMGARGGIIAPDSKTIDYLFGKEYVAKGAEFELLKKEWILLKSDTDAIYDIVHILDASQVDPMITYGTNPGMGMSITSNIPESKPDTDEDSFAKSLKYMGFKPKQTLIGHPIDYVFLGSCTNGRIEDFRAFVSIIEGGKKNENVIVWLVPGSKNVEQKIEEEGLGNKLRNAGFELRQPGCSACLGMNEDKIPPGKYSISTSNRNFEGRQGPQARTILSGPYIAAVAALTGKIDDPRKYLKK